MIYDITVKDKAMNEVSLRKYESKIMLIVNTASNCGFTPQFAGLETLHKKYPEVAILGFPSNTFNQELANQEEIIEACQLNYGVTFDIFAKIEVNGKNESELYTYLKEETKKPLIPSIIKWNFEKFLIDQKGTIVKRYSSLTTPEKIEKDIIKLLQNK